MMKSTLFLFVAVCVITLAGCVGKSKDIQGRIKPEPSKKMLENMPEEMRPLAREYFPILMRMSAKELEGWVHYATTGQTEKAYENLVAKMTTEELIQGLKRTSEELRLLNKKHAEELELQRQFIQDLIQVLIMVALEKL